MRKDTKASIDEKISKMTDDNYYVWYQLFHNAGATNRSEIAKYYVDEIAKKFGKPDKLQDVFEKIYRGEGLKLNADTDFRKKDEFKIELRGKNCNEETVSKETYIQRNLFVKSSHYEKELGHIFGYEVTFVRANRLAPVDLVSFDFNNGKLTLHLIELKACKVETINTPAKDLLLRAMFEVATYKAYFEKVLTYNDELACALKKSIKKVVPDVEISIEDIKNATIHLIVLAPDYIINEKDEEFMKAFLKPEIRLLTISAAREFDKTTTVGREEKLFNIV